MDNYATILRTMKVKHNNNGKYKARVKFVQICLQSTMKFWGFLSLRVPQQEHKPTAHLST